jgi:hypothetical protein
MQGQEPWFKRDTQRQHRAQPRARSEEQVRLALGSLPLYHLMLTLGTCEQAELAQRAAPLGPLLGQKRAAQALADLARYGSAVVATCPRELAEHYCNALARYDLPCAIIPV